MPESLKKAQRVLIKTLEIAVMVVMAILVIDVLWGVATRFPSKIAESVPMPKAMASVLGSVKPSSWTGELATMMLIWVSLLGASVAFLEKSHLGVDYFVGKLPARAQAVFQILVYGIICFFGATVMMLGGYQLISLTLATNQTSAALGVKMGYVYMALPISGFFIVLFTIETMVGLVYAMVRGEKDKDKTTTEQEDRSDC